MGNLSVTWCRLFAKYISQKRYDWCVYHLFTDRPPVDLYLIFEKSSCKNQVRVAGFLACKNQFWNWFLQATQAVKNQVWNRQKIKFVQFDVSNLIFQKSNADQLGV